MSYADPVVVVGSLDSKTQVEKRGVEVGSEARIEISVLYLSLKPLVGGSNTGQYSYPELA